MASSSPSLSELRQLQSASLEHLKNRLSAANIKDLVPLLVARHVLRSAEMGAVYSKSYVTRTGESLLERLPEEYTHLTVNHSYNFVDPDTGAHTQTVESTWQKFKRRHKHEYGTHRSVFSSYVSDFVWRRKFMLDQTDQLEEFIGILRTKNHWITPLIDCLIRNGQTGLAEEMIRQQRRA